MGLGAISCKGSYAEVGKTEFGKGALASSDFDGEDILMGATLTLSGAMIGAMLASICYEWDEKPQYPVKRVTIESGPYRLDGGSNWTGVVHEEHANETYQIRLEKIESRTELIAGKILSTYHVAHMDATNPDTLEVKHLELRGGRSLDLSENFKVHAEDVGRDFAELVTTEKYSVPLKED